MKLNGRELVLTNHAYKQYCARVGMRNRLELYDLLFLCLRNGWAQSKNQFIKIDNVWWVYLVKGNSIVLKTCYGEMYYDLPKALKWARKHNDRLRIGV